MRVSLFPFISLLGSLVSAALPMFASEDPDWVQIHADIQYERSGTPATTKSGHFVYTLKASLDQLMVRVPAEGSEKWHHYFLLDEYPRTGTLTGAVTMTSDAKLDAYSASANLKGLLASLDSLWIESIKPEPTLVTGLTAEIKVAAKLSGSVKCDLPGDASKPPAAIMVWPSPISYSDDAGSFLSEGSFYVFTPFLPRPKEDMAGMLYDTVKASTDDAVPGIGGLSAPSINAVVTGTPDKWELTLVREAKPELPTGGEYSHRVKITLRPVPKTLPSPKPTPEP